MVMPWVWLIVIVISLISEMFTLSLTAVWFIPGALVSMILSFFDVPIWVQSLVFFIISLVCMVFVKPIMKRSISKNTVSTNADRVIGQNAVVVERIHNLDSTGQVKVGGQVWTARAEDPDAVYEVDEILTVVRIEGVKLICKK